MEGVARTFGYYFPSENERQTERDLVRPVLEVLGHTFEVQAPLESPGGTKRPDYVFYHDVHSLNVNKHRTLNDGGAVRLLCEPACSANLHGHTTPLRRFFLFSL
jgi:hypothetical protein